MVADGRAGRETSQDLREAAAKSGCIIDKVFGTNAGLTAKQMMRSHPEGVLLWLDTITAARTAQALRKAGFLGILAGPGRLQSMEFVKAAGEAAEDFMVAGLF